MTLWTGSRSTVLQGAAADLPLTGETSHHDALDDVPQGMSSWVNTATLSEAFFLIFETCWVLTW